MVKSVGYNAYPNVGYKGFALRALLIGRTSLSPTDAHDSAPSHRVRASLSDFVLSFLHRSVTWDWTVRVDFFVLWVCCYSGKYSSWRVSSTYLLT